MKSLLAVNFVLLAFPVGVIIQTSANPTDSFQNQLHLLYIEPSDGNDNTVSRGSPVNSDQSLVPSNQCEYEPLIQNGAFLPSSNRSIGAKRQLKCIDGSIPRAPEGDFAATCRSWGAWTFTAFCPYVDDYNIPIEHSHHFCGQEPLVQNGAFEHSHERRVGTRRALKCIEGFQAMAPKGDYTATCRPWGAWTFTAYCGRSNWQISDRPDNVEEPPAEEYDSFEDDIVVENKGAKLYLLPFPGDYDYRPLPAATTPAPSVTFGTLPTQTFPPSYWPKPGEVNNYHYGWWEPTVTPPKPSRYPGPGFNYETEWRNYEYPHEHDIVHFTKPCSAYPNRCSYERGWVGIENPLNNEPVRYTPPTPESILEKEWRDIDRLTDAPIVRYTTVGYGKS